MDKTLVDLTVFPFSCLTLTFAETLSDLASGDVSEGIAFYFQQQQQQLTQSRPCFLHVGHQATQAA